MKRVFLSFVLSLWAAIVWASGVVINGITYELNSDSKTAYVTYMDYSTLSGGSRSYNFYNKYSGSVSIPPSVEYNGDPYSVTAIGDYAFKNCSKLTSITIPNSVTRIGFRAFEDCDGLTRVNISDIEAWCRITFESFAPYYSSNPLYYAHHLFLNNEEITELEIPASITNINRLAFAGCTSLTNVIIPNSVTNIGYMAFAGCYNLNCVNIPNSVTSIGENAFEGCNDLTRVDIDDLAAWCNISFVTHDERIYSNPLIYAHHLFLNCKEIKEMEIPSSVTRIGERTFCGCSGLTSVTIPNSVTGIGEHAFSGCLGLTSVTIPNSVTGIGSDAFADTPSNISFLIEKGSWIALYLWENDFSTFDIYDGEAILKPILKVTKRGQQSLTFQLENYDNSFFYSLIFLEPYYRWGDKYYYAHDYDISGEEYSISGLKPDKEYEYYLCACMEMDGYKYKLEKEKNGSYNRVKTISISPTITKIQSTASSLTLKPSFNKGDIEVVSQTITIGNMSYQVESGKEYTITGLCPNTTYNVSYTLNKFYSNSYESTSSISTDKLVLITQQPKVVSVGNVIVAAETNVDEVEKNLGFEWRRTDWEDDFQSNSSVAFIYGSVIEGYIRNLNTDKLWKYRPYYEAANGTRYYGDWVGIDPTNTSYYEPTVHTYGAEDVTRTTAHVRGYVLAGTDDIVEQGFEYWQEQETNGSSARRRAQPSSNAQRVTATGVQMDATLTGLKSGTTYHVRSFARTSSVTIYGEEMAFTTEDPFPGDVNRDGEIDGADIVTVITYVLDVAYNETGDVNGDKKVNGADIVAVVNYAIAFAGAPEGYPFNSRHLAPSANAGILSAIWTGKAITLALDNEEEYTAFQFLLNLPAGVTLADIVANEERIARHRLTYRELQEGQYFVLGYNTGNNCIAGTTGTLLNLLVDLPADGSATFSDVRFFTPDAETRRLKDIQVGLTTAIERISTAQDDTNGDVYDAAGRLVITARDYEVRKQALPAGVYIRNGKKFVVK